MSRVMAWARCTGVIALTIGYILLAHYTNTTPDRETLGSLVALSPILLAAISLAWRSAHRSWMLALLAAGCAALFAAWSSIEHHYSRIYWMEHAGSQFILCLVFARTLGQGREPMCTYFARMVHGSLTPAIERYTRQVTAAWVIFFGMMSAASTVIFFAAPLATWSLFANFFTAPLICLMFIAEYAVRRCMHPDVEHVHILAAVKAFWNAPAGN
jgi:uncharacterized membrane protein